jgi:hypothetical protein
MLAAAVAMVFTRGHATAVGAELALGAAAGAFLLTGDPSPKPINGIDRNGRERGPEKSPAIRCGGESPRHDIESVVIHRHPCATSGASHQRGSITVTCGQLYVR